MPRLLLATLAWVFIFLAGPKGSSAWAEELLVFVQRGASPLQADFLETHLPEIESLAAELDIPVRVIDLAETSGAPPEVKITPLLVFQDWRGRSVYQGRYATPDRITNFLRTARALPQGEDPLVRERVAVRRLGRAALAVPLKITELTGPGAGAAAAADAPAQAAFAGAVRGFDLAERVELGRADRLWYANFYPYAGEAGFAVTAELYSQFHCHEPVWTSLAAPAEAAEVLDAFAAAARALAAELERQLQESTLGDGFDAVPASTESVSWERLGLGLPPRPVGASADDLQGVALPTDWVVASDPDAGPAVLFAFPSPLDAYAGEVTSVRGELRFASVDSLAGVTGRVAVDARSVTMGEEDLDAWIHDGVLKAKSHPEAWFDIESVEAAPGAWAAFGRPTPATLVGTFTMKGTSVALTVPVQLEAFVAADGQPRLRMDGAWTLPIAEPFGIEGPPGDEDASSKLKFVCRIVYAPAG